jgi:hypothetical protein
VDRDVLAERTVAGVAVVGMPIDQLERRNHRLVDGVARAEHEHL